MNTRQAIIDEICTFVGRVFLQEQNRSLWNSFQIDLFSKLLYYLASSYGKLTSGISNMRLLVKQVFSSRS